jgi:hypothetical protein
MCVVGGHVSELENHLLATCLWAWVVWSMVHWWFGMTSVMPDSIFSLFDSFLVIYRKGKMSLQGAACSHLGAMAVAKRKNF